MALIIEDGSQVTGADSYVTLTEARAHATARSITLSAVDATLEGQIRTAMDYFESYGDKFKGQKVDRDQALQWPRTGVVIESWTWDYTEIPRQVKNALLALILEVHAGEDLFNPSIATMPTIRKKVDGAVEVEYANPGQALKVGKEQPSQVHIRLLLKNSGLFAVRS